jgi:two-component system, NarL family, response regulator NreC
MSTRVVVADDHGIMREGLCSLIRGLKDMQVVGEAPDGRTAARLARELSPDLMIMDISMPDLNGIDATRQILHANPAIKIIALSMHADKRFIAEMFKAGASGYLLKDAAFEELQRAIETVLAGQTYLCSRIAGVVVKDFTAALPLTKPASAAALTPRERETLQLFAEGNTTKQIAMRLHVSVKTVETHRRNIMQKLHTDSIAELTKYAIREGLTSLEH